MSTSGQQLKIIPLLALFSLLHLACYKDISSFEIRNLNDNTITILGHRGMGKGYKYPGNSFESIESALSIGADGVEIDVQITKDSVLVVFHDKDLSKKTNFQGMIRDYNWSELDSCNYRSQISNAIQVITVDSLFSRMANVQDYYFSFDCSFFPQNEALTPYFRQWVHAIEKVVRKYNMHNRVLIEAANFQFHQLLKQGDVQAYQFITGSDFAKGLRIAEELDLYGIGMGSAVTRKNIELAHEKGFRVMTWTPKSRWANIRAIKKNPDYIQTAKPIHMLKLLGKYRDSVP